MPAQALDLFQRQVRNQQPVLTCCRVLATALVGIELIKGPVTTTVAEHAIVGSLHPPPAIRKAAGQRCLRLAQSKTPGILLISGEHPVAFMVDQSQVVAVTLGHLGQTLQQHLPKVIEDHDAAALALTIENRLGTPQSGLEWLFDAAHISVQVKT